MSRRQSAAAVLLVAGLTVTPATAAPDAAPSTILPSGALTPAQQALLHTDRFRALAAELRCLVCQNQTLLDSHAELAQDLRNEVVRLMESGRDDAQIRSYLVDRYGPFVLYKPEVSGRNALLWFGPFVLLAAGALAWWKLARGPVPDDAGIGGTTRATGTTVPGNGPGAGSHGAGPHGAGPHGAGPHGAGGHAAPSAADAELRELDALLDTRQRARHDG